MLSLEQLQVNFFSIFNGGTAPFIGIKNISLKNGEAIYRRNYQENHIQALSLTYKSILKLVGQYYFKNLAIRYLSIYPSDSGDLNDYGQSFPDFLAQQLPILPNGSSMPYLPDVAHLDWACWQVMLAPTTTTLNLDVLPEWSVEQQLISRLKIYSSMKIISSNYPIYSLWNLIQTNIGTVDISAGGETILLGRPDSEVVIYNLTPDTAFLLEYWQKHTLEESVIAVTTSFPNANITELFANLNTLAISGELWIQQ